MFIIFKTTKTYYERMMKMRSVPQRVAAIYYSEGDKSERIQK